MKTTLPLGLLMLLGAALRLYGITARSLWLDEATSIEIALKGFGDILSGTGFDRHTPPLYYLILSLWLPWAGVSELGLRLLSAAIDVCNIWLVGRCFKLQFSENQAERASIVGAALYACSPFAIYYAQEGRMYTLLLLLVLVTYLQALHVISGKARALTYVILVLAASAGMYTHYYYALSLAAITLGVTICLRATPRRLRGWYAAMGLVFLAFLPWVHVVLGLAASGGQPFRRFTFAVLPYTYLRFIAGYAVLPLTYGSKDSLAQTILANLVELLPFAAVFSVQLLLGAAALHKCRDTPRHLLLCALFLPPCAALAISMKAPMLGDRYLIVIYPFFLMLLGAAFLQPRSRARSAFNIGVCLLSLYALSRHYTNPSFGNTQWRDAVAAIEASGRPGPIYLSPPYVRGLVEHYGQASAGGLPAPDEPLPDEFWLLERGSERTAKEEIIARGYALEQEKIYPLENGIRAFYFKRH